MSARMADDRLFVAEQSQFLWKPENAWSLIYLNELFRLTNGATLTSLLIL